MWLKMTTESLYRSKNVGFSVLTYSVIICFTILSLIAANSDPIVVVITGCSSGIGKQIALDFAKEKRYKVWATMRSPDKWDAPSMENLEVARLDVTSEDSVNELVQRVMKEDGKIDILVNNAGYGLSGCLESATIQEAQVHRKIQRNQCTIECLP
jgi:NAD(P)-dependent dehydrogenase (short-subunit alcohol dehydrogenase family)